MIYKGYTIKTEGGQSYIFNSKDVLCGCTIGNNSEQKAKDRIDSKRLNNINPNIK